MVDQLDMTFLKSQFIEMYDELKLFKECPMLGNTQ